MKEIKLAAMDIDGTILGKNGRLSEETKRVFKEAADQGIHLVIASGRAFLAIPQELLVLKGVEYVITSNGSSIFRILDGERIYGKDLAQDQLDQLIKFYRAYECPMEVFIHGIPYTEQSYYEAPEKFGAGSSAAEYVRTTRRPEADMIQLIKAHQQEIEGINFIVSNPDLKIEMREKLKMVEGIYVTSSVPRYIEISHGDVCKANALKWLADYLKISRENIIAFGDGENDLEMIQYAGIGVAMGNGAEIIKKAADVIGPTCDEEGIAKVLGKKIRNKY